MSHHIVEVRNLCHVYPDGTAAQVAGWRTLVAAELFALTRRAISGATPGIIGRAVFVARGL